MTSDSICCHLVTLFFKWSNKIEHVGCCWLKRGILGWMWLDKFGILYFCCINSVFLQLCLRKSTNDHRSGALDTNSRCTRVRQKPPFVFLFRIVLTVRFCWIVHTVHVHCHGFSWNLKDARKRSQGRVDRGSLMAFHWLRTFTTGKSTLAWTHAAHWMVVLFWVWLAS